MSKFFQGLVTDETLNQARKAGLDGGWFITPYYYHISDTAGVFTSTRTIVTLNTPWYTDNFNATTISKLSSNKVMFTIVIPGDASPIARNIAEICFVAKTPDGNDFLYVVIQPTTEISYTPGITIKTSFAITLNNTTVADTYTIQFTNPVDIETHNIDELAHQNLLSRYALKTQIPVISYED